MFKITHPAVVMIHACRSAGRGRGRLSGFPCMDDGALHSMPQRLEHDAYRNMPYILPRSYLSF